jgi:hypothetical protein
MKKTIIKVAILLAVATASVYLYYRHQQAVLNQQETPTDSDCCTDICDSIPQDTIIHLK